MEESSRGETPADIKTRLQKQRPKNFKGRLYTVRRAESLYDIAQKYGIRLKSLVKKNKQLAENGLHIGDQVILY